MTPEQEQECDGCFNQISECHEYGSCLPRFKRIIEAKEKEVAQAQARLKVAVEVLCICETWFDSSRINHHSSCNISRGCDCGVVGVQEKIRKALREIAGKE